MYQARRAWPLFEAARHGKTAGALDLLKDGADPNARVFKGGLPLNEAVREGHAEVVQVLLEHGAEPTEFAMRRATERRRHQIMRLLIGADYDPAAEDDGRGTTALHHVRGDTVAARILLDAGAHVNARSASDQTPLLLAVESPEVTRILLEAGAEPNVRDEYLEMTPLEWAAERGALGSARLLLEHGADPIMRWRGRTAVEVARESGHKRIAKLIEQYADGEEEGQDEAGQSE